MITGKQQREAFKAWRRWNPSPLLATFLLLIIYPSVLAAQAEIIVLQPLDNKINDTFHVREEHPLSHAKNVPHWGTDIRAACGTPIPLKTGGNLICPNGDVPSGNAGIIGQVDHGCGVVEQFFHLTSCTSSGGMISGKTGTSTTPCHLHHEVLLDGVKVNPQRVYTAGNLCNEATKKKLIAESKADMNGKTNAGGGAGTNTGGAPAPATQGGTTYVPPGGSSPSGEVNNGGGYYIIDYGDGRTEIVYDVNNNPPGTPGIPPGTPPDLTPTTDTDNEVTGCATDTWTAMVNQSVLQTRREMIANELFIRKPDSVMAYSCLTQHMEDVYNNLGPVFSETKRWVNVEVDLMPKIVTLNKELGETSLDGSITNLAIGPYEEWMASMFSHDFLGGTLSGGESGSDGEEEHDHAYNQAYTPCGVMATVWQYAKCKNVDEDPLFYKFEDLINADPRKYPAGYECNNSGITQAQIDIARGKEVKFDKVQSYVELLYPGEGGTCAAPIKTGVTAIVQKLGEDGRISKEETYPDALCLTVGCNYDKEGGKCVVNSPPKKEEETSQTGGQ